MQTEYILKAMDAALAAGKEGHSLNITKSAN